MTIKRHEFGCLANGLQCVLSEVVFIRALGKIQAS